MTKTNKITIAIVCLAELAISLIVWSLRMQFDYANRFTCTMFICVYAVAAVAGVLGFVFSSKTAFVICSLLPVLFGLFYCLMQFVGGGFVALFNEIYLPRVISLVLCVAMLVFVAVYPKRKKE